MTSIIASFDIGKKNFAFIIEEVDLDKIKTLTNIPVSKRYNKDGTPTEAFSKLLDDLYNYLQKLLFLMKFHLYLIMYNHYFYLHN